LSERDGVVIVDDTFSCCTAKIPVQVEAGVGYKSGSRFCCSDLEARVEFRNVVVSQKLVRFDHRLDFKGFSYGFRQGRGPHEALDALTVAIQRKQVNWILDADI